MERRIRLLIADDSPRSRDGLRALLATWPQVEVVGEAADGQETVRLVEELRPHVVLMDAQMPRMNGLEATRLTKKMWPEVKVIMLTMYTSYRTDALAADADSFLVKGCPAEELLGAILDHQGGERCCGSIPIWLSGWQKSAGKMQYARQNRPD